MFLEQIVQWSTHTHTHTHTYTTLRFKTQPRTNWMSLPTERNSTFRQIAVGNPRPRWAWWSKQDAKSLCVIVSCLCLEVRQTSEKISC